MIKYAVTKRNAASPVVVHVPAVEVLGLSVDQRNPDALKVVARRSYKWTVPDFFPMEEFGAITRQEADCVRFAQSCDEMSRVLPDNAIEDFVGTKELDVYAFVAKYGMFHWNPPDTLEDPDSQFWLGLVPSASASSEDPRGLKFKVFISGFKAERDRFRLLLGIFGHLRVEDVARARARAEQLKLPYADDPRKALSYAIGAKLHLKTRFALGDLQSVVLKCEDVLTGLYALLLQGIVIKASWSSCPKCGTVFSAISKKRFCGPRCEQNEKQRRYRQRKATQEALRKGRKRKI